MGFLTSLCAVIYSNGCLGVVIGPYSVFMGRYG